MVRATGLGALILLASIVAPALGRAEPAQDASTAFSAALAADERGDAAAARAGYQKVLMMDPGHGRALINLGILDIRERQVERGLAACEKARAAEPGAAKAHYCIGLGLAKLGKDEEAAAAFTRASELFAPDPMPRLELGHLRRKQKRYEEAIAHYKEAVRARPDDAELHVVLGYCYKQLGQWEAAEVEYKKAVQKDSNNYFGHLDLGVVLVRRKKDQEARLHYLRAAELDPKAPEPHFNLGNLLRRQGELAEAKEQFQAAVKLGPADPSSRLELARVLWRLGETVEARAALDVAASLSPPAEVKTAIEETRAQIERSPGGPPVVKLPSTPRKTGAEKQRAPSP